MINIHILERNCYEATTNMLSKYIVLNTRYYTGSLKIINFPRVYINRDLVWGKASLHLLLTGITMNGINCFSDPRPFHIFAKQAFWVNHVVLNKIQEQIQTQL